MKLDISEKTAKRLYPESQSWFREVLEETFGRNCFKKKDWKYIKTYEDACEALGLDAKDQFMIDATPDEKAYIKLKIIIQAINQGWTPDWSNSSQYKYSPWFDLSSGFGFSRSVWHYSCAAADVGSRLCFESKEKSDYTATQFFDVYKEFLTITK